MEDIESFGYLALGVPDLQRAITYLSDVVDSPWSTRTRVWRFSLATSATIGSGSRSEMSPS